MVESAAAAVTVTGEVGEGKTGLISSSSDMVVLFVSTSFLGTATLDLINRVERRDNVRKNGSVV